MAQLILLNAKVHTMDPTQPVAEAIAIGGGRITAIGSNEQIRGMADAKTRVINAEHGTVLPGFNDAHVHFLAGGFSLSNVDLRDARSPREFTERIRRFVAKIPTGQWIVGGEWDHEN